MSTAITNISERPRALFLAANPKCTSRLRLAEEAREIQERIERGPCPIDLQTAWAVRIRDLQYLLMKHAPQIVHFSGHGVASQDAALDFLQVEESGSRSLATARPLAGSRQAAGPASSELVLEDDSGGSVLVSGQALAELFAVHREHVRCVVLSACYSKAQAEGIARSIDFVVGMSRPVQDRTAIAFAAAFYQGLAFGHRIADAFEMGLVETRLHGLSDCDVPQLITRNGADLKASFPPAPAPILAPPLTISTLKRAIKSTLPGRELDGFLQEHFTKEVYWRIVPTMPYSDKLMILFDQVTDLSRIHTALQSAQKETV